MAGKDEDEESAKVGLEETLASPEQPEIFGSDPTFKPDVRGTTPDKAWSPTRIGDQIDRYSVLKVLGRGGMGIVVLAEDPKLHRRIALKLLSAEGHDTAASQQAKARLLREARAMAKLKHPNVLAVYDVGTIDDQVFIAMEYADGGTLRDWVKKSKPPWREVAKRYQAAGRGLVAAHEAGLIHRDFKPENVLTSSDGRVQVGDFGLVGTSASSHKPEETSDSKEVSRLGVTLTSAGAVLGTPAYMAPEQFRGEPLDERADQFSFCVSLYEAFYGEGPFDGDSYRTLRESVLKGIVREAPPKSKQPSRVRSVLLRGLALEPSKRHASMSALLAELERATQRPSRLRIAAIALFAALAILLAFSLMRSPGRSSAQGISSPTRSTVYVDSKQLTFSGDVQQAAMNASGTHLAYVSGDELRVRKLGDQKEQVVAHTRHFTRLRWSSDGVQLLYIFVEPEGSFDTFAYSTQTRKSEKMDIGPGYALFLPDGGAITGALDWRHFNVFDLKTGESREVPVSGDYLWLEDVDYSAETKRLAIVTATDKRSRLWTMRLDGSDQQLVAEQKSIAQARWSLDGKMIFFSSEEPMRSKLYQVEIDLETGRPKGEPVSLFARQWATRSFSLLADGAISYARGDKYTNIWHATRLENGTFSKRKITSSSTSKRGMRVAPNKKTVAYTEETADGAYLMTQRLEPLGEARIVTKLRHATKGVAWSPDGKDIAYVDLDDDDEERLYRVSLSDGRPQLLDLPSPSAKRMLRWAPLNKLMYQLPGNQNFNLADPVSGAHELLIPKPEGWFFTPAISPNGQRVAVDWNRTRGGIWTIDMKSRESMWLGDFRADPLGWSRDGQWIFAFSKVRSESAGVLRISAESGEVTNWLDLSEGLVRPLEVVLADDDGDAFLINAVEGSSDVWIARPE